ncbi:MAG TPA: hypothetical protein HA254_05940 [Candidatus Diapherotrites archaeon]|uniref:AbiEi antitoxin C-terminal domain-containing protein n=1 Tax=Candidatus Iainarchaeum sp. TaxID=3101447 RepID=A0A7J4J290_9ARCH|nr:hypothetical protein [Candidatus Diapherotrites archaeon]
MLLRKERYISREELRGICSGVGLPYNTALMYLFTNKYLLRVLRGFFYIPGLQERRLKSGTPSIYEAIGRAMEYKKVSNWYFGLESAIKLNNITHEVFTVDFVVSDTIFRPKPMEILGHRVKFVKLGKKLFGFGVKREGAIIYSDLEKTVLDLVHIRKHNSVNNGAIWNEFIEWAESADHKKMAEYARNYSKSVREAAAKLT